VALATPVLMSVIVVAARGEHKAKPRNAMPLQPVKRVRLTAVLPLHLVMTPNAGSLCHRVKRQLEVLALC
jgi:hypothetical protein